MRFLCLHGRGSSSTVGHSDKHNMELTDRLIPRRFFRCRPVRCSVEPWFHMKFSSEAKLAKLREELDDHEFVFVNGTVPTEPSEGNVLLSLLS